MRVVLQKVVSVVKLQKYVKLPLDIYVKVFLSIGLTQNVKILLSLEYLQNCCSTADEP
jgi:hypothetical protein